MVNITPHSPTVRQIDAAWPSRLAVHTLLVAIFTSATFWLNVDNLLSYIDGHYLLTLVRSQMEFASPSLGFSTNPLQGLNDLWYFANTRWIPELAVAQFFSDPTWQKIAIHTTASVEMFVGVSLLAFWLGVKSGRAVVTGWFAVLVISPLSFPSLFYNVTGDFPILVSLDLTAFAIIVLWAGIGRGPLLGDALRAGAISFLTWVLATAFGLFFAVTLPFIVVFGVVFFIGARNRAELLSKFLWGGCVLVFLVVSGLPEAMLGMSSDTYFHFFLENAYRTNHPASDGSLLLRYSFEPISSIIAALGVTGSIYCILFGSERRRQFALATTILVGLILSATWYYATYGKSVAIPLYYEMVIWPIYVVFAMLLLFDVVTYSGLYLLRKTSLPRPTLGLCAEIAIVLSGFLALHGPNYLHRTINARPNIYPPTASILTNILSDEVGLFRGSPFRGRVVTMTGQGLPAQSGWNEMFGLDLKLMRAIGNEHRTIGLWYYGIPTLIEFSHTIPPELWGVATQYLAPAGDGQSRNILNMRLPNLRILRLLGVRYIITDGPPTPETERVQEITLEGKEPLALDVISETNLGISPTETVPFTSSNTALAWLGEQEVDFAQTAMLSRTDHTKPLMPARAISITMERGGFRVRANTSGHSLVVVPFAFSNCLRIVGSSSSESAELKRVNLLLTGILFEGSLDVLIEHHQTPFSNTDCLLKDVQDIEDLNAS